MRLAAPHDARNTRLFVPALDKVIEESEVEDDHTGDMSTEPSDDEGSHMSPKAVADKDVQLDISQSLVTSQSESFPAQEHSFSPESKGLSSLGSADSSVNNSGMHESASSIESQEGSQPDQPDQQEHQLPGEAVANDSSSSQECEDESNDTNKSTSLTFGNSKCRS